MGRAVGTALAERLGMRWLAVVAVVALGTPARADVLHAGVHAAGGLDGGPAFGRGVAAGGVALHVDVPGSRWGLGIVTDVLARTSGLRDDAAGRSYATHGETRVDVMARWQISPRGAVSFGAGLRTLRVTTARGERVIRGFDVLRVDWDLALVTWARPRARITLDLHVSVAEALYCPAAIRAATAPATAARATGGAAPAADSCYRDAAISVPAVVGLGTTVHWR